MSIAQHKVCGAPFHHLPLQLLFICSPPAGFSAGGENDMCSRPVENLAGGEQTRPYGEVVPVSEIKFHKISRSKTALARNLIVPAKMLLPAP